MTREVIRYRAPYVDADGRLTEKDRPGLVLTPDTDRPGLRNLTIAPITSSRRPADPQLLVGIESNLDHDSYVSLNNITTIPRDDRLYGVGTFGGGRDWELMLMVLRAFGFRRAHAVLSGGTPEADQVRYMIEALPGSAGERR